MKLVLLASALVFSSAAVAQTTTPPTNDGVVQTNVTDGSAPERDARGIPVVSGPAVVPPGANQAPTGAGPAVPAPNQAQVFTTQTAAREYPPCTRQVTDGCVQTYERGVRR